MSSIRDHFTLLGAAYRQWSADRASDLAAALSYYTVAALVPLIVLIVAGLSIVFGETPRREAAQQITLIAGSQIGQFFGSVLAATQRSHNVLVAILSAAVILATAVALFNQVKSAIDRMWRAPAAPAKPFWHRFLPSAALFLLFLAIGILLFAAAVFSTVLSILEDPLLFGHFAAVLDLPFFFVMATLFFLLIYRFLPSVKLRVRDLTVGAAATAIFFTLGRFLMQLYFNWRNPASAYGTASAAVLFLFWVYYSAQIFYFGVEFTYVYAKRKQFLR